MQPPPTSKLLAHVAPILRDDTLGLTIVDPAAPDARGGTLQLREEALRQLPAAIEAALARYDAQRGRA